MPVTGEPPPPLSLLSLCDELLLHILAYLEIPELLACSRTHPHLRRLTPDPLLHRNRLHHASRLLALSLPLRPPLSSLRPPAATIYLTLTLAAARKISVALISIRLERRLAQGTRPSVRELVGRGVLPGECFFGGFEGRRAIGGGGDSSGGASSSNGDTTSDKRIIVGGGYVSPGLVGLKRGLERERVKDGLRGWLVGRRVRMEMERRSREGEMERERGVKGLVRRFAGREKISGEEGAGGMRGGRPGEKESRWGRGAVAGEKRKRGEPTRAHVYALRRFWEGVGREAQRT